MLTAKKENLSLLAILPLELEVVKEGDAGDIGLLDNEALLLTQQLNKMVDKVIALTQQERRRQGSCNEKCMQAD